MLLKKSDDGFVEMGTYPEIKEKLLQRRLLTMKYKSVTEIMEDERLFEMMCELVVEQRVPENQAWEIIRAEIYE